MPHAKQVDIR